MAPPPTTAALACHDCDLLHAARPLAPGEKALCSRCGSLLARGTRDVATRTFAFSSASLILLVVANSFPFMEFQIAGRVQVARLYSGITQLHSDGYDALAGMVLFTSVLAPFVMIAGLLALSAPMLMGKRFGWMVGLGKALGRLKAWSMMEVFLLGAIVSAIKLSDMADIVFGPALYAFVLLILTSTASLVAFDPARFWDYLDGGESA